MVIAMKNKAQTTFITVILLGIVLSIVMYMYYYSPTNEKTAAMKASNAVLQERVNTLEKFFNEMPENKKKIAEMETGIQNMISGFPADVLEEDTIYLALRTMNLDSLKDLYADGTIAAADQIMQDLDYQGEEQRVSYNAIGIAEQEELGTIDIKEVTDANIEGLTEALTFNRRVVTYQNVTDYNNLKGLIQSINCDPDKKTISNLAYTVDEEGKLTGSMTVMFYSLTGTGRAYEPKDLFTEYEYGVENLFTVQNVE